MFNSPYMYNSLAGSAFSPAVSRGLIGSLKSVNWSSFLSNTQKTLGVINQAIPLVYQVKPIMSNAKTMLRIANTINTPDEKENKKVMDTTPSNKPVFYI